uniref:Uncharacterized protein n=1 Tax=Podoviridae sp. ct8Lf7 TaxID=2827723 RepID=A0A8S5S1V0_9CAUD|nr:MAG TPA: hypothetical protein [Podoviridae sp. ct8Lf7]
MNYVSNISTSHILICLFSLSITYLIIFMPLDLPNQSSFLIRISNIVISTVIIIYFIN